ncbi:MAG: HpcH/HpaI aldolase family protein [Bryobacteraceae bacterium]
MTGKEVRQALLRGDSVYGTAVLSTSPLWPGFIKTTGIDFVFIDTEHTPIERQTLSWICHTYRALGLAPMVRIPEPDPYQACMVLDGGACGVLAPYIETPEQVRALVGAVRWRPLKGKRLYDYLEGRAPLEPELIEYLNQRNQDRFLVINIESVPAMRALDEILAVPGIDAVQIGPHDLSCSLGVPEQYHHPKVREALSEICRKTRARGIGYGVHYWLDLQSHIDWAKEGANLIMRSSDLTAMTETLKSEIAQLRSAIDGKVASAAGSTDVI